MKIEKYTVIPTSELCLEKGEFCYIFNCCDLEKIIDEVTEEVGNIFSFRKVQKAFKNALPRAVVIDDFKED